MKEILWAGLGISVVLVAGIVGVPLLNITLGPSSNTLMYCKELEKEGYLADECFDEDGMRKPPFDCKRPKKESPCPKT